MLLRKEIKKIACSIPYLLFVAAIVVGLSSQGVFQFQDDLMQEPKPGENYGVRYEEIPELVMPAALEKLWGEFCKNEYVTYPLGFIKYVKLSDKEQAEMAGILAEITGIGKNEILREGQCPAVRSGLAYARFQALMQQADKLLGGGSNYAAESLPGYGAVPLTYEEARERYQLAVNSDQVTGGYARLFADYAGVMVMSMLPVFLAVILCMKDRRSKMEGLIYTRQASAARIVLVRFLALLVAAMVPLLLLSYLSNMQVWEAYRGVRLDYLAPLKYSLGWIMPCVMISIAVGMFLTELTGTPLAVALQGLWWFFDINQGIRSDEAGYALLRLAPRHNVGAHSWFQTQRYLSHFQDLAKNRLLLAGASLLLLAATVYFYEAKRKGKFHGDLSFKNFKTDRKVSA